MSRTGELKDAVVRAQLEISTCVWALLHSPQKKKALLSGAQKARRIHRGPRNNWGVKVLSKQNGEIKKNHCTLKKVWIKKKLYDVLAVIIAQLGISTWTWALLHGPRESQKNSARPKE